MHENLRSDRPFHHSGVAKAAPKGGRDESRIPLLTCPGSSGILTSNPAETLSAPALGPGKRQRFAGPPHRQRCWLPIAHLTRRKPKTTVPRPAWGVR